MLFQRVFGHLRHSSHVLRPSTFAARPLTPRFFFQKAVLSTHPIRVAPCKPFAWPTPSSSSRSFFTSSHALRYYPPPQRPNRGSSFLGFLDNIPQNTIFYGIMGINTVVFVMWYMSGQKAKLQHDPSSLAWMYDNFTNSWRNLTSGRIWTLVTSCFSHEDLSHILVNSFTFYFMAQPVLQMLGSRRFIFLYLGGGLISTMTSMVYALLVDHRDRRALGASGAIYSVVSLLACASPMLTFRLYGIIPVPAWLAVTGLFAYDTYSTVADKRGRTDTVGHIGGILAGIAYFLVRRVRRF